MNPPVFEKAFEIRFTEIDHRWNATALVLFNLMQETAVAHSESVGRGPAAAKEHGFGWFLTRLHMRTDRYPRFGERIVIRTWPVNLHGLHAIREFEAIDSTGTCISRATTRGVVIDVRRRRPCRVPAWIAHAYPLLADRAVDDPFDVLPELSGVVTMNADRVRLSDTDSNAHANSSRYIDWMLESVRGEISKNFLPAAIEIAYKRELQAGEELETRNCRLGAPDQAGESFMHALNRKADGTLLATGRISWRRVEDLRPDG